MLTTADRIEVTKGLIGDLEGRIAAARAAAEQARATRSEVALAAAEGDDEARARLAEATAASTAALLEAENHELALAAAKKRLGELERLAEHERGLAAREQAIDLCRRRMVLAAEIDACFADLERLAY